MRQLTRTSSVSSTPNVPSSGKHERFGAASEWFSDDLVCYADFSTGSISELLIFLSSHSATVEVTISSFAWTSIPNMS